MHIRLNRNGQYWSARWTDHLGRPRTKGLGRVDKVSEREAMKKIARLTEREVHHPSQGGPVPTLAKWGATYLELRESELSDGTVYLHKLTIGYLTAHFGADVSIDRITRLDATAWRAAFAKERGGQTVALHVRNAKVLFQRAVELDLIARNPFDRENGTAPAVEKSWRQVTDADMDKIFAACPSDAWRCMFALARWGGLRQGEALRMAWSDIDWAGRILTVRHEGEITTKKRTRTVPIQPKLFGILEAAYTLAQEGQTGPGADIDHHNVTHTAQRILGRSVGGYRKPFHTLRKCLESEWMAQYPVLDVAAWLGHSPAVAARHYTRPVAETVAKVTSRDTIPTQNPQNRMERSGIEPETSSLQSFQSGAD